jgi:hypothetical protein
VGADSLEEIYGGTVPIVKPPAKNSMNEFAELVIRGLTDVSWRQPKLSAAKQFAERHTYAVLAADLEALLLRVRQWKLEQRGGRPKRGMGY